MISIKKFLSLVLVSAVVSFTVTAADADKVEQKINNPHTNIADIANKLLAIIEIERPAIIKKPSLLEDLVEQHLIGHVDYKFAALKVLGKHYRKVPKEKLPEYVKVFRKYLIATYADALFKFEGYSITFAPLPMPKNEKVTTVRAIVSSAGKPDINIAFKARHNKKTGEWKVYDMIAEGISLLSAKQSEVSSVLRQNGIDSVMESMRSKSSFVLPQE